MPRLSNSDNQPKPGLVGTRDIKIQCQVINALTFLYYMWWLNNIKNEKRGTLVLKKEDMVSIQKISC